MHDPTFLPDYRPDHLAVSSLAPGLEEGSDALDAAEAAEEAAEGAAAVLETPRYEGPERRSGPDRRLHASLHSGNERRVRAFGRRQAERKFPSDEWDQK